MKKKMNLKKLGVSLAAVAASTFIISNLSGCATETAAQNSTAAVAQMQNTCKGMVMPVAPAEEVQYRPRAHRKGHRHPYRAHEVRNEMRDESGRMHHGKTHRSKSKGSNCGGAASH